MQTLHHSKQILRKGTILLELIVAIFLVGTTGMAIYMALIYGQIATTRANHQNLASSIASQTIENIRATDFPAITTPYNGAPFGSTTAVNLLPNGTVNLVISYFNAPTNTIKKAVVTVTWLEKTQTKNVTYTTLISDSGLSL